MAQSRSRSRSSRPQSPPPPAVETGVSSEFTGKYLVLLRDNGVKEGLQAIKDASGLTHVCSAADYEGSAVEMDEANKAEVFFLDNLKVAVVDADPTQLSGLQTSAAEDGAILAVEPERIMYALTPPNDPLTAQFPFEYLRGYKDAVNHLYASLMSAPETSDRELAEMATFADNTRFTWGLQAARVSQSRFSGRSIRLAVLDTGFDLDHPDFVGRSVVSRSFISGQMDTRHYRG